MYRRGSDGSHTAKRGNIMNLFILKTWIESKFSKDERGASLVEYVLLAALIAIVVIGAITLIGTNANKKLSSVGNSIG